MSDDEYGLIRKYFSIDQSIIDAQERIKIMRFYFYTNNFYTRQEYKGDDQQTTRAFKQENEVARLVDSMAKVEKNITKKNLKNKYLYDYIHTLPLNEQTYLKNKYISGQEVRLREDVESSLLEEIHEIEEAVQWMFKEEIEITSTVSFKQKGFEENFEDVLIMLGVWK